MSDITEIDLIKKAAKGDPSAFEELMLQHQTQVYNLCYRMTGNAEDAEDMTQETFLKAWKYLEGFHMDSAFSTWLYRLASNSCLDLLRSKKRKPTISLVQEDEDGEEMVFDPVDPSDQPDELLLKKEERQILQQALASLEDQQRAILTLRVVNDMSYEEISRILQIKEGTVKSRLARAREHLRKIMLQLGNKSHSPSSKTRKEIDYEL